MSNTIPTTNASTAPDEHRGVLITFEGGEGAGKTTHIRFLADTLRARGRDVLCLREPGGTAVGEQLRSIVLDPANEGLSNEAELLAYEMARAQLVSEVIKPALERGVVVLCDRFTDSTVAYQACGRGLSREFVDLANDFACQGIRPDRTILLASGGSVSSGLARATKRAGADRLERAGEDFHARVNEAFMQIADEEPDRVRVVISSGKKSETSQAIFAQLADLFPWMNDDEVRDPAFFEPLNTWHPSKTSKDKQA